MGIIHHLSNVNLVFCTIVLQMTLQICMIDSKQHCNMHSMQSWEFTQSLSASFSSSVPHVSFLSPLEYYQLLCLEHPNSCRNLIVTVSTTAMAFSPKSVRKPTTNMHHFIHLHNNHSSAKVSVDSLRTCENKIMTLMVAFAHSFCSTKPVDTLSPIVQTALPNSQWTTTL
jgi:hypothetical protein